MNENNPVPHDDRGRPAATGGSHLSDIGIFLDLGQQSQRAIDSLKRGSGPLTRELKEAVRRHRQGVGLDQPVRIIPVVLLYHRAAPERSVKIEEPGRDVSTEDDLAAPIVVELGPVQSSHIEELLGGGGKLREELEEVVRLVQRSVAMEQSVVLMPIVTVYQEARVAKVPLTTRRRRRHRGLVRPLS